jgi:type IV secretion system protein VirB9
MRVASFVGLFLLSSAIVAAAQDLVPGVREVTATDRSVITLNTKLRFTTMIVLPDHEEILDVVCGDKDFWVISAAQNIAHVKPAKEGAATNLNLVTSSGMVYSFLLNESQKSAADLKVYVVADATVARAAEPKYYSATRVSALQEELSEARAQIEAAAHRSSEAVASFRQAYPGKLAFNYDTPKYEKPFFVRSIWHDGEFTYIKSDAKELPALYEVMDGRPALVNFQVQDGTYVIPKVLDRGYLALGKERLAFQQGL